MIKFLQQSCQLEVIIPVDINLIVSHLILSYYIADCILMERKFQEFWIRDWTSQDTTFLQK